MTRPTLTILTLLLTDLWVLLGLLAATVWVRYVFGGTFEFATYWQLWPITVLFPAVFGLLGLYPGAGVNPPEELRRLTAGTTLVYLLLGATTFLFKQGDNYSRLIFLAAWALSLSGVPLCRALVRHLFAKKPWWGYPVLVLGAGQTGSAVVKAMRNQPGLGYKPIAFLDDNYGTLGVVEGVVVLGRLELAPSLALKHKIRHAIVAIPGASRKRLLEVVELYGSFFPSLTIIPDLFGMASLWVSATDLGGMLGLELRHNLLQPTARLLKRLLDLLIVISAAIFLAPLLALLAVAVALDSRGPAFFAHQRIGQDGKYFFAWKFRTMVSNSDQILKKALNESTDLMAEWNRNHKLKTDPRVTRVGRWLRRTSLDELPQLWNVLKGEMSLVGPRPIVDAEVERYGDRFELFKQVQPGITGLWQVSGRNDTTYEERVALDTYYVRNWSPWLDFYLLARTVWAVFWGRGAY